jgi:hypothetical protein
MKRAFALILLASGILWLHGLVPARAATRTAGSATIQAVHNGTSILPADDSGSGDSGSEDSGGDDSGD